MTKDYSGSLPETMRAVVCHGPGEYKVEEVPVPRPGPGEVVIKVEACGICAGDVKAFHGAEMFWGGGVNPAWMRAPVIPGHEFVGIVKALGEGAGEKYGLEIGDRAISEQIVPCGKCRFCTSGQYWMCEVHNIYGFQKEVNGGMAEYMLFPETALNHKVPHDLPLKAAAMIEPFACSLHAVNRAKIQFGEVVVISGAGPLGMGMVGAAKLKNPDKLIVLDLKDDRLEMAKRFGADLTINPAKEDADKIVKDLTDGYGCDVYIEATGHPQSVIQGLTMIRKLGKFVEFSVFSDDVTVDWSIIGDRKELDIYGAHLSPYLYPIAIDFAARGIVPIGECVSHEFPLEEFEKAYEIVDKGENSMKVILVP